MREIKYRAWYNGKMYTVAKIDLWGDPDEALCDLASLDFDEEELFSIYLSEVEIMQSTGLHDKNGIEIYEGDVVKVIQKEDGFYMVAKIVYIPMQFIFQFENGLKSIWGLETNNEEYEIEKIGNIYDNPELLESGE